MKKWSVFCLIILIMLGVNIVASQDSTIILSLAYPQQSSDIFNDALFQPFEDEHPNVQVNLIPLDPQIHFLSPSLFLGNYLGDIREYVSMADIIPINSRQLSILATRAGFLLDLQPLISADSNFSSGDFIPNALESFQWDNGTWGIPMSADAYVLMYNRTAFDEAGLNYPNSSWAAQDFANAIYTLAEINPDISPFPMFNDIPALFRSLLDQGFTDPNALELTPEITTSEIEAIMTIWDEMNRNELLGPDNFSSLLYDSPMHLSLVDHYVGAVYSYPDLDLGVTLLPNDLSVMFVNGFSISGGTQHPELAYELLDYVTQLPELLDWYSGEISVRTAFPNSGSDSPPYTSEQRDFLQLALDNALPASELLFSEYLIWALLNNRYFDTESIVTALQDVELQAIDDLEITEVERETPVIVDRSFMDTVEGVDLRFGIGTFGTSPSNMDTWQQVANEFADNDPEIGRISFDIGFKFPAEWSESTDCYALTYNAVQGIDLNSVMSLDPLMNADATFQSDDFLTSVMSLVQRENQTWAYPFAIQPYVMGYDREVFDQLGISAPESTWTVEQFADTLNQLSTQDNYAYTPRTATGLYMLISAYGGLPIDYSTTPPTVNLTAPETINAIRQVLDLAISGEIDYERLVTENGNAVPRSDANALIDTYITAFQYFDRSQEFVAFPAGMNFTPLSLDIVTGYISANTQNIDGCYRWLTTLSEHPELFDVMPARYSQLNQIEDDQLGALYGDVVNQLASPNVALIPSDQGSILSPINYTLQTWLNRVFDRYVLDRADLEQELVSAQDLADEFITCTSTVSAIQTESLDEISRVAEAYAECAIEVDPNLVGQFGIE